MAKSKLTLLLNQARHAWMKQLNAECSATLGVTVSQLTALFALTRSGDMPLSRLSEVLMLDNGAVTRLAQRLEAKGLAMRQVRPDDRRAKQLVLTPLGREKASLGLTRVSEANAHMTRGFTDEEIAVVERWLQHLITPHPPEATHDL